MLVVQCNVCGHIYPTSRDAQPFELQCGWISAPCPKCGRGLFGKKVTNPLDLLKWAKEQKARNRKAKK